jgi:hypothetical protein
MLTHGWFLRHGPRATAALIHPRSEAMTKVTDPTAVRAPVRKAVEPTPERPLSPEEVRAVARRIIDEGDWLLQRLARR